MIKLGVIPGHDERARAAGTAAHGGAAIGIVGEFDVGFFFDQRQHFVFDELGVLAGHGVVLETALAALGVAAAVADGDGDHDRQFVLGDHAVERSEQHAIGAVGAYDERRGCAGHVCLGHIDGDLARVGRGMAGGDDELGGISWIGGAEGAFVARDAGIVFAVGGLMVNSTTVPLVRSCAVISGAGGWVGPMMKLPSALDGGSVPSGSCVADT